MTTPSKTDKILIVGAGCFGLSTAYHLLKRGYTDITVIDRAETLPAVDGASNDFNRVVRTSYDDPFYAKLAQDAIIAWKNREEWGDTYHEAGSLFYGKGDETKAMFENNVALGLRVKNLENPEAIRNVFPPGVKIASFEGRAGHLNLDSGWANAFQGTSVLLSKVVALGGTVIPGKKVKELIRRGGKTTGLETVDGTVFEAELVIVATGSWTASAFPTLEVGEMCLATGQCVAMVQLTPEEGDLYRDVPVVMDYRGFYVFPPNEDNLVKMALHASGYIHTVNNISTPRTIVDDPERGLAIPKLYLEDLRRHLRSIYPDLAEKRFLRTRLCWYNDSPDGDWIIGPHPTDAGILFATAGSGHAYKFLPVIGRLVADAVERKLPANLAQKFAINRKLSSVHVDARYGQIEELDLDQLCTPEDL